MNLDIVPKVPGNQLLNPENDPSESETDSSSDPIKDPMWDPIKGPIAHASSGIAQMEHSDLRIDLIGAPNKGEGCETVKDSWAHIWAT